VKKRDEGRMKNPNDKKRLEMAAYREAAHAVACYLLHKRFKYVTIYRERMKVDEIVYPEKISTPIPSERELKFINREYMVFLAGMMAERIFLGKCKFEDLLPLFGTPFGQTEKDRQIHKVAWKTRFIETKLLIYMPRNWQAVIYLAEELLISARP